MKNRKAKNMNVSCVASSASLTDQYRKLNLHSGASETGVNKAFHQLALQYRPDVCKETNCGNQFQRINEAYDKKSRFLDIFVELNVQLVESIEEEDTKEFEEIMLMDMDGDLGGYDISIASGIGAGGAALAMNALMGFGEADVVWYSVLNCLPLPRPRPLMVLEKEEA
ncbi:hypothetical protein NE237_025330 [Protea cynaroides]|uniref:J domain-containing protein n=1 Tax=Protea cynaroides TaxID=273540 RepID=A0A9Q0JZE9_9MAGN|nr:hypothetical protein NE237_025330 [Protea cynaroides]